MAKHTCKNCEKRHYACWDTCPEYLAAKKTKQVDEVELYFKSKGKFYKTKYGWRR